MHLRRLLIVLLALALPAAASAETGKAGGAAFLKSLVVPGWGQHSLGRTNTALAFLGTEVVLIGGMLTLNSYGASVRDDYRALAAVHAGVTGGHGHDYYVDVGNWLSVDDYNAQRLRERDFAALYTDPADYWRWSTDADRAVMEAKRIKSDRAFNSVLYLVGGVVLNHIASAIHAGRMAARLRGDDAQASLQPPVWSMHVRPLVRQSGVIIGLSHSF